MRTSASNLGRGLKISLAICPPSNNRSWRDEGAPLLSQNTTTEVLNWRDAPRATVDARPDPAASALWAEPAPAGGVLYAGSGLHLPPSAATITAQRGSQILPLSCR